VDTVRSVDYECELLVLLFLYCTIHRTAELTTLITDLCELWCEIIVALLLWYLIAIYMNSVILVDTVRYREHFGTLYFCRFAVKLPIFYVYWDAITYTNYLPCCLGLGLGVYCLGLGLGLGD